MSLSKRQREMLAELCQTCNKLGAVLDPTATNPKKYQDRQVAHIDVYRVLYAVLCDDPENDLREDNINDGYESLINLKEILNRQYGDRTGF